MNQITLSDCEYACRRVVTSRSKFLTMLDEIIPWDLWVARIKPFYPDGKRGRKPIPIETMLRMYTLECCYSLSDVGVEEEIYESRSFHDFMRIDFLEEQVPDSTTLLHFRHLLEEHDLGDAFFADVNAILDESGLMMHGGTIVDATIISSSTSTKNREKQRDPEMHQTKKGNQWYHGMKLHLGADAGSGYIHTVTGTAANVADIDQAASLIREDDEVVYADSGYLGLDKRPEVTNDEHLKEIDFRIALRPSSLKMPPDYKGINWDKVIEGRKASVRSKVENAFLIIKRQFGFRKTLYRGLAKNMNRIKSMCAFANLVMCARAGRTDEFCMGKMRLSES